MRDESLRATNITTCRTLSLSTHESEVVKLANISVTKVSYFTEHRLNVFERLNQQRQTARVIDFNPHLDQSACFWCPGVICSGQVCYLVTYFQWLVEQTRWKLSCLPVLPTRQQYTIYSNLNNRTGLFTTTHFV